jgi:hypothetical protein
MRTDQIEARESGKPVSVYLERDEALVLYELLAHAEDDGDGTVRPDHHAEQLVLWRLRGILDEWLIETLLPDYHSLVDAARERLAEGWEN